MYKFTKLALQELYCINYECVMVDEKKTICKETRPRSGKKRSPVLKRIAEEFIPYGSLICEVFGEVKTKVEYKEEGNFNKNSLFHPTLNVVLCNDKDIGRRSCRPNSIFKSFIRRLPIKLRTDRVVSFGIFAVQQIEPKQEILLNLDFEFGNDTYEHECCCSTKDCLLK